MGFDLFGQRQKLNLDWSSWRFLYELAALYGWIPQGTAAPGPPQPFEPISDWCGTYFSSDWQIVTAEDSEAIAKALQKALNDIPLLINHSRYAVDLLSLENGVAGIASTLNDPATLQIVRQMIELCEAGSFRIG